MEGIWVIAVEGGPCGGKSTAMERGCKFFRDLGYTVLVVRETPTDLINDGVNPWDTISNELFQEIVLDLQLARERSYMKVAEYNRALGRKVIIFCDRGSAGGLAYIDEESFKMIAKKFGMTVEALRNLFYDAIIHLRTAAIGAEKFYKRTKVRRETRKQARKKDMRTFAAWAGHQNHTVIKNNPGATFDDKMNCFIKTVARIVGAT